MRPAISPLLLALCAVAATSATLPSRDGKVFEEGHRVHWTVTLNETAGLRPTRLPDLSGDGIDDLAAGAQEVGLAVYSGADGTRLYEVVPPASATHFASAVSDAGDVDRDGVHDLAVATGAANLSGGRGTVRWYSGRDGHPIRETTGTAVAARFGTAMVAAGDLDGDGIGDLLVGAPGYQSGKGRAFVISGANAQVLTTIEAPVNARGFGFALARIPDRDGDRVDDFVIGAPAANDGRVERLAYVLSGATFQVSMTVAGPSDSYLFGIVVGSAGDFDGDRVPDFIVADPSAGVTAAAGGAVGGAPGIYQVHSGATGAALLRLRGVGLLDEVGRGGGAADFNGDGFGDVMVGTRLGKRESSGTLTIYAGPDARVLAQYSSLEPQERFADVSLPFADIDGDGKLDIVASTKTVAPARIYAVAGAVATASPLVAASAAHSGLWLDPAHAGEGFALEMHDDGRAGVYYFTFTRQGTQRYFLGLGSVVGKRVVFDGLISTRGGGFGGAFPGESVIRVREARLVLSFDGCDSGYAEYTVDGASATQRLVRLTAIPGLACNEASTVAHDEHSGSWFDPQHAGEGWVIQAMGPDLYAILWFSYAQDGEQQWFTAVASRVGSTLRATAMNRPVGGRFGPYFNAAEVVREPFGEVSVEFSDCGAGRVSWSTPAGAGSAPIVRLTALSRVACVD